LIKILGQIKVKISSHQNEERKMKKKPTMQEKDSLARGVEVVSKS